MLIGNNTHIYPINDIYPHTMSIDCHCKPKPDEVRGDIIVHNAFDFRDIEEFLLDVTITRLDE